MFVGQLVVFLVGIYTSQGSGCLEDWQRHGETCYSLVTTKLTWEEANGTCADRQAQMAVPRSQMEQDAIWEMFRAHGLVGYIWIGCSDIEEEGKWRPCPSSGNISTAYQNWKEGQPDDNEADCAAMMKDSNGLWGDRPCNFKGFAACQLPADTNFSSPFCPQTDINGHRASPCMIGHVLKETPVIGVEACGKACLSEPQCLSFNLLRQGPRKMLCQLNDATRDAAVVEESLVENQQDCTVCELWAKQQGGGDKSEAYFTRR